MEERENGVPQTAKRNAESNGGPSSSSKRIKVNEDDVLPDPALLYHFAYSTWECANRHLAQVFLPSSVQSTPSDPSTIHLTDPYRPTTSKPYEPDVRAAEKALSLQLLAIDTLKIGLNLSSLSDTERVTFGLLFGKIGMQVVQAIRAGNRKGKEKEEKRVDHQRLLQDIEEQVNISVCPLSRGCALAETIDGSCAQECLPTTTLPAARAVELEDIVTPGQFSQSSRHHGLISRAKWAQPKDQSSSTLKLHSTSFGPRASLTSAATPHTCTLCNYSCSRTSRYWERTDQCKH
jgi:hypothetical protein